MTSPPKDQAPGSLRLVLTLAIAGLLSGIAIIGIYESTLPTITANKARELREAVFKVLPGVTQMQALVYRDDALVVVPEPDKDEPVVYGGYDDAGQFIGYAVPAAGPGFQDTIALLYGYIPAERKVVGMEILESRETPGLGDKIEKDEAFLRNFEALDARVDDAGTAMRNRIVTVKSGTKTEPWQIDAITGATITSKAVGEALASSSERWIPKVKEWADEHR